MLTPKSENQNRGYFFSVSDDEIKEHMNRSTKDIFQWLESTNRFVNQLQTPKEKERSRLSKTVQV